MWWPAWPAPLRVHLVQPDDNVAGQLVRAQVRELRETWHQHQRVVSEDDVDAELGPQATAGLALLALARRDGEAVVVAACASCTRENCDL